MDSKSGEFIIVMITVSSLEDAKKIARRLIEEKVAACVNIIPSILSIYRWNGSITEDNEILLIIKTLRSSYTKLEELVLAIHPYQVPEIIATPIENGAERYMSWVRSQLRI